jgi:MinD-like ATPase involved in chromosome partitioning or flagellar assembly
VLGVLSGRGASGVSLVSALLALASARSGRRTLLVDADPWLDVQRIWMGLPKGPRLETLRSSGGDPESLVVRVGGGLELASLGTSEPTNPGWRALVRRIPHIFAARQAVVVDAGSRLEALERCADLRVGSLLIVTEVDAVALGATHALVKAIRSRLAVPWQVVVNRAAADAAEAAASVLAAGMRRFMQCELASAGYIPHDLAFRDRLAASGALLDALADSSLIDIAPSLMDRLAPWRNA